MTSDELICSTSQESIEVGFEEPLMFDELETTFYPGSIIDVSTIPTGEYERVTADRVPLNLTINPRGMSIDGSTQLVVENPTLGSVRDGVIELRDRLDPAAGEGTAQMDYSQETVYSEEMTKVSLGAHYEGSSTTVDAEFDYDAESESHEALVQLQQVYYSVDVDLEHPGAFFLDGRTPEPTSAVVDRVNYGRIILFNIRSSTSISELNASVEGVYEGLTREGGGSIDYEDETLNEESEVHATVFGGGANTGGKAVTASDVEEIEAIVNEGSSYGPDHPGAPISYHMTYLIDGSDANVMTSTDYTARSCERRATTYRAYDFKLVNEKEGGFGRPSSDPVYGYIRVNGKESADGDDVFPDEGESPAVKPSGDYITGDEALKQVWVRTEDEGISVDRAGESETSFGNDYGVRELEDVSATIDFPSSAEDIEYSSGKLRVAGHLTVGGDFAGWDAVDVPLDEIKASESDHSITYTTHDDDPMKLRFRTRPVFE